MPPVSRLGRQLQEAIACLERAGLEALASGGAAPLASVPAGNPYQRLDDLMAVVEALCPVWPPREIGGPMNDLRL